MESIIKPLPEAVHSAVRSGFIISDLTSVVEELLYNSLDAVATKVSVYVGANNGYVKVEDDGSGISRDGLVLLGERYATSKLHTQDKDGVSGSFGFRGEVLCSIADISLVEIVTKVHGRPNGYRKVMKGRKCLYLSIDNDRQDVGTTVIVRDLFYNQPVRRRQMQSSSKKILHLVKKCAVQIALMQPRVSFKVVDVESEDELFRTHASSSPLSVLCTIFGIEASSLHEVSFSEGSLMLTGYVSCPSTSSPSKAIQYIYVNSRFVVKGPIHKTLNRLADLCLGQLTGDKGGKRGQPNTGATYCLNLTCPRSSYDLNLEFSRTSVEFKDWAPVLTFIEKSVASLWCNKTMKVGSYHCEAEQTTNSCEEIQKDWLLKTCDISAKRRRVGSTKCEQSSAINSSRSVQLQVEDDTGLSLWQDVGRQRNYSLRHIAAPGELESKRAFLNQIEPSDLGNASPSSCNFNVKDSIVNHLWEPSTRSMSFNEDIFEDDITVTKRDRNHEEAYLSSSVVDGADARSCYVGSGWGFDLTKERNEAKDDHIKLFLQNPLCDDLVQKPLDYGNNNRSKIGNLSAKRSYTNSIDSGDVVGLSHSNVCKKIVCQNGAGSGWPSPSFSIGSDVWNDIGITSVKCHDLLSLYQGPCDKELALESLGKHIRVCSASCFSMNTDQQSTVSYSLNTEASDLEGLIPDGGFERRPKAKSCDGFELFNDDKEEFYHDDLGDRPNYENFSSTAFRNSTSCSSDYAGVEKGIFKFSPHGHSIDDISLARYDGFSVETCSPSMERRGEYRCFPSVCWSPSVIFNGDVTWDVQRCQALEAEHIAGERLGRDYNWRSPDGLLSGRHDDILADEAFSPYLDCKNKLCTRDVSSISVHESPKIDLQRCQIPDPNSSFPEHSGRSYMKPRRSHSAPPTYRGKRRFLSMKNDFLFTAESFGEQTNPQVCNMIERDQLEHPPGMPLTCDENFQHGDASCTEESLSCADQNVQETSNITSVGTCNWNPGYLKQFKDSESSRIKWRDGCEDMGVEDIIKQKVGDMFNQGEDENAILDIHSCILHLAGDSLVPQSINRNCLDSAKVLLQVDNKFIPVVASGTLAVIDQHAADERIRLEEMRQQVLSGEMKSITYLEEEKELVLPEMAYQLLCNYAEHIQQWGWMCNIFSQDSRSFAKNLNLLNAKPTHLTLLTVPCILGVNLSDADLLEYLEQLSDTDGSSTIPPSVLRILNYKACRGAIMFGDKLLPSECSLIVEELKRTSLCFQCAHGRPTTVPLVNLEALRKGILQLQSWHEEPKDSWHGLRRGEINLRRAENRLNMAKGGT